MLRFSARWVLPVSAPPIEDGALLVDDHGRIVAIGGDAHVPHPESARSLKLGDAALLPGLVDVHAHPELAAFRGLIEDLSFPDWIATLQRVKGAAADRETYEISAHLTCIEAIAAGVTTLAATEDSAAALCALSEAGLRGVVYVEVFGPAPAQASAVMAELQVRMESLRRQETDLVRIGVSPHAPFTVSDALFSQVAAYALREDLPVAVHAAESPDEQALVTRAEGAFAERLRARGINAVPRGRSTIDLLERAGVLDTRLLLIHCVHVDQADIARIAAAGATVAHCPAANARLGHGVAPLLELRAAGIAVGLGGDSVASNNRIDMLEEARLAQMLQRAQRGDPEVLPASELLRMATLDGARALGIDSRTGSLESGKDADLCAVSLTGPHVQPVHDPAVAVIHAARAADVILTAVRGRILHGDGTDTRARTAQLRTRLDDVAKRLRAARAP
jgi:cytosine/adenosine deaminase-related metal-dependent hydrolase